MAFSKDFERKLNELFRRRTHWLRAELGNRSAGKPPEIGRKEVTKAIEELQLIASDGLTNKLAKKEFERHVKGTKNYFVKGRGPYDKRRNFENWYKPRFKHVKAVVYAFWGTIKEMHLCRPHRCARDSALGAL